MNEGNLGIDYKELDSRASQINALRDQLHTIVTEHIARLQAYLGAGKPQTRKRAPRTTAKKPAGAAK